MKTLAKGALAGLALLTAAAIPGVANAANAYTTGDVNLRTGPGVGYAIILVVPAHMPVDAFNCVGNWCQTAYAGYQGWVSASYLAGYQAPPAYVAPPPPPFMPGPMYYPQPDLQLEFNFGGGHPPMPPHLNGWSPWGMGGTWN